MAELKVSDFGKVMGIQKTKAGASAKESAWLITASCCNVLLSVATAIIAGLAVGYILSHYDLNQIKAKLQKVAVESGYLHGAAEDRIMELGLTLEDVLRRQSNAGLELDRLDDALQEVEVSFEQWASANIHDPSKVAELVSFIQQMRETVAWYTQDIRRDSVEADDILGQVSDLMDTEDVVQGKSSISGPQGGRSMGGSQPSPSHALSGFDNGFGGLPRYAGDYAADYAQNALTSKTQQASKNTAQGKDWFKDAIKKLAAQKAGKATTESDHKKENVKKKKKKHKKANKSNKEAEEVKPLNKAIKGHDLETRIDKFFVAVDQAKKIKISKDFIAKFQQMKEGIQDLSSLKAQNRVMWQKRIAKKRQEFSNLLREYGIFDVDKYTTESREKSRYIHDISLELEFIIQVQKNLNWLEGLRKRYRNAELSESRFFRALRTDGTWKAVLDWLTNKADHKSILLFQTYVAPKSKKTTSKFNRHKSGTYRSGNTEVNHISKTENRGYEINDMHSERPYGRSVVEGVRPAGRHVHGGSEREHERARAPENEWQRIYRGL